MLIRAFMVITTCTASIGEFVPAFGVHYPIVRTAELNWHRRFPRTTHAKCDCNIHASRLPIWSSCAQDALEKAEAAAHTGVAAPLEMYSTCLVDDSLSMASRQTDMMLKSSESQKLAQAAKNLAQAEAAARAAVAASLEADNVTISKSSMSRGSKKGHAAAAAKLYEIEESARARVKALVAAEDAVSIRAATATTSYYNNLDGATGHLLVESWGRPDVAEGKTASGCSSDDSDCNVSNRSHTEPGPCASLATSEGIPAGFSGGRASQKDRMQLDMDEAAMRHLSELQKKAEEIRMESEKEGTTTLRLDAILKAKAMMSAAAPAASPAENLPAALASTDTPTTPPPPARSSTAAGSLLPPTAPAQEHQAVKGAPAPGARGAGSPSLRVTSRASSSSSLMSQRLARTLDQALNTMGSAWDRVREVSRTKGTPAEQGQGPLQGAGDSRSGDDGEVRAAAGAVAAISTLAGRANGLPKTNQDAAFMSTLAASGIQVYGVLDGHGEAGEQVSGWIRSNLVEALDAELGACSAGSPDDLTAAVAEVFADVDAELFFLDSSKDRLEMSGATATIALLQNGRLLVAGLGDSRAILGGPDGSSPIRVLTHNHYPSDPVELARIHESGGEVKVFPDELSLEVSGRGRVFVAGEWIPGLAVARAFGDFLGKRVGVSVVPDVTFTDTAGKGQVLIIATDGVWDVLDDRVAMELCVVFAQRRDAKAAAKTLTTTARELWESLAEQSHAVDDITALVAFLP